MCVGLCVCGRVWPAPLVAQKYFACHIFQYFCVGQRVALQQFYNLYGQTGRGQAWPSRPKCVWLRMRVRVCVWVLCVCGVFRQVYAPYGIHHLISTCRQHAGSAAIAKFMTLRDVVVMDLVLDPATHTRTHTHTLTYTQAHTHAAHTKLSSFKTPSAASSTFASCQRINRIMSAN